MPHEPRALELAYSRELIRLVQDIRPELWRALGLRQDADGDVEEALAGLRVRWGLLAAERASVLVDRYGARISRFNADDIARILRINIATEPLAVRDALMRWRDSNVRLIKSIPEQLLTEVYAVVTNAAREGLRVEQVADQILKRFDVSESRARLIGRDQILKANADLTRVRHIEAGVTSYVWSTSRDERVRPMHEDLDGTVQRWDDPPVTNERGDTNAPGEDYQCRCVAVPILD